MIYELIDKLVVTLSNAKGKRQRAQDVTKTATHTSRQVPTAKYVSKECTEPISNFTTNVRVDPTSNSIKFNRMHNA